MKFLVMLCLLCVLAAVVVSGCAKTGEAAFVTNGDFEVGRAGGDGPGKPPALQGWWFYDDVGMLWRTAEARYAWTDSVGREGSMCLGFGPSKYPGARTFFKLEPGHYEWSFSYRTVNRKRPIAANLFLMTHDVDADRLTSTKSVRAVSAEAGRFVKFQMNRVRPTKGKWKRVTCPVFEVPETYSFSIMFEPFFMPENGWMWVDDVRVRKVPKSEVTQAPKYKARRVEHVTFRTKPDRTLLVHYPQGWKPTDKRPALIVCRKSDLISLRDRALDLGMVAVDCPVMRPGYGKLRWGTLEQIRNALKPRDQVMDIKSAVRYVRKHAARFGIDPGRIVGTGASGGADLIFLAHLNKTMDYPDDDRSVSASPNALILYCPSFCNGKLFMVKTRTLVDRTRAEAPAYLPYLTRFIMNTTDEYATPLDRRDTLIALAATLGKQKGIPPARIKAFQAILGLFRKDNMQLLHPVNDVLDMCCIDLVDKAPMPPTLIMFGDRDHLYKYQMGFVNAARAKGEKFDLKIYKGAGHSFMIRKTPYLEPSTQRAQEFLEKLGYVKE